MNVADVVRVDREARHLERPLRVGIDVSDLAVADAEQIDLERVDLLERLLPPLVLDGRRVLDLPFELRQVDVDARAVEEEVGDEVEPGELAPLQARVQLRKDRDRRLGMGLLPHGQVRQVDRHPDKVEVRPRQQDGVALQARVHPLFHVAAQGLVPEERGDDDENEEPEEGPDHPERCPRRAAADARERRSPSLRRLLLHGGRPFGDAPRMLSHARGPFK